MNVLLAGRNKGDRLGPISSTKEGECGEWLRHRDDCRDAGAAPNRALDAKFAAQQRLGLLAQRRNTQIATTAVVGQHLVDMKPGTVVLDRDVDASAAVVQEHARLWRWRAWRRYSAPPG